jgi:hypothetical protein
LELIIFNETVTGTISSTTAIVKNWNSVTNDIRSIKYYGSFVNGDVIVGSDLWLLIKLDNRILIINDPYADNDDIEIEADSIH